MDQLAPATQARLRRWVIVGTGVSIQFFCYRYAFAPSERLAALGASLLAYAISAYASPTPEWADIYGGSLSLAALMLVLYRSPMRADAAHFFETLGCSLHTTTHYGPQHNVTWEGWSSGSWCTSPPKQMLTIGKAMDRYRVTIQASRCYTACLYTLPSDGFRWHGFITSAPPSQVPGKGYCGDGYLFGQCPPHDKYYPDPKAFQILQIYPPPGPARLG